jgi:D-alanine-D-alanine ligase
MNSSTTLSKAKTKRKASNRKLVEVLGPVDNLESYVKADWWRHIFNANYLRTDGDVVSDETITQGEVDVFEQLLNLDKSACILDLCCGQGRHLLEFARRDYSNVHGMDRSHYLINRAKTQARKENLTISLKEGDARKLPYKKNQFDAVTVLGNSFGYFETQEDDQFVLAEILRVLKPQGKLLIDITDGDHMRSSFEPRSWEWIDKNYFVCRERSLSADNDRLVSREVITHVKKGVVADQFYAERLYTTDSLQTMLEVNGFSQVGLKQALNTLSQRAQDLGMMAKRNIIIGLANKPEEIPSSPWHKQPNIAVLMGDPRKSDKVKPGESFDDDDLFTINALKKALVTLKGFTFSYFNNHDNYFSDTKQWKKNFDLVLNLCDEGFNNDPTFELHVPALLEMLDIPYSGGNPQCLSYCYDKSLIRGLAIEIDIPVANAYILKPQDTTFIDITIPFPMIIKPNFGDSSFGITQNSVCYSLTELEQAILSIRQKFGYESPVLIEEYLEGKDISVGIIGNPSGTFQILPIIEEDYSLLPKGLPKICGYEAKWDPDSPYSRITSIAADLPSETIQFLHDSCLKLFDRTGCRDYARFDWRLDSNGTPRLLEVNPNPGWCWDGHLAKMAKLDGLSYADMLKAIVQAAIEREGVSVVHSSEQQASQHN